jgi:long-chain acyl-CoA synthetase
MDPVQQLTLGDVYTRCADLYAERTAAVGNADTRTFQQVDENARRLADSLHQQGLARGDRIAILSLNNLEYLECIGAAATAGLVLVPINFRLQEAEIGFVLADSGARLIFAGAEFVPVVERLRAGLPELEHVVVFDREQPQHPCYGDILAEGRDRERPGTSVTEDDLIALMYTAAVSGRPRGAMMTHRSFVYQNAQLALTTGIGEHDVNLNVLPMFHTMGLSVALTFFHLGALNVVLDRYDPSAAAEMIEAHRVTFLAEFSPMAAQILDAATRNGVDLSSLRQVFGLDTPATIRAYLEQFPGLTWLSGYGQAETHGLVCVHRVRNVDELEKGTTTVGRPGPLNLVRIVDDNDDEVRRGQDGEIVVRGPNVSVGYWRQAEATGQTTRGGWHHTGDLGRLDAGGCLWFAGRKAEKDLIKTGGENVYPEEVEGALKQHPGVSDVCVIGVADPEWTEAVKAVIVRAPGAFPGSAELIDFCKQKIASYKKPRHLVFVETLPKSPSGAIDRRAVKDLYGDVAPEISRRKEQR